MTPEEILKYLIKGTFKPYQHDLADLATNKAIEAIKQYAREMCDKQKRECANAAKVDYHNREFTVRKIAPIVRGKIMVSEPDRPSIYNAPYPKELL